MAGALPVFLAASIISSIAKSAKSDKYQDQIEEHNKQQKARAEKQARMAAMSRALGNKTLPMGFSPTQDAPEAPSTVIEDILGAIGGVGSTVAGRGYGKNSFVDPASRYGRGGAMRGGVKNFRPQPGIHIPDYAGGGIG